MKIIKWLFLTTALIIFLVGCESEKVDVEKSDFSQINEQNEELQEKVAELEDKIKMIEKDNLLTSQSLEDWYAEFDKKYSILRANSWDEVVIKAGGEDKEITISDEKVLTALGNLIGGFKDPEPFGSGPFSDERNYQYTFIKDGEKLTIETLGRNIIVIGDDYFETGDNIHLLGNAFYPPPSYFKGEIPIVTKLALSSYMEVDYEKPFGMFSTFRIVSMVNALADQGKAITNIPSDISGLSLTLRFYFFGEEITLNIYEKDYVQITDADNDYWYTMDDTSVFHNILNAG